MMRNIENQIDSINGITKKRSPVKRKDISYNTKTNSTLRTKSTSSPNFMSMEKTTIMAPMCAI